MTTDLIITDNRHTPGQRVRLEFATYANTLNNALQAYTMDEYPEPWARYSVNPDEKLPPDQIAIKDWSENEGTADLLMREGIIEPEPQRSIASGFVVIHVYKLTPKAILALSARSEQ